MANYEDASLDDTANSYGKQIRTQLQGGSGFKKPMPYLNYAQGDEPLGDVYGYENWRLGRLRQLKKSYDPKGAFNFYGPISSSG